MKKSTLSLVLAGILSLSLLVGCGGNKGTMIDPDVPTVMFTDSVGREVEVPETITRISPSGKTAQLILFALAPDMLVSISSAYSLIEQEYLPKEYHYLPVIGQFYGTGGELNYEEIAKIGPEVIIDLGETKEDAAEDMDKISKSVNIPAVHIEATTETMPQAYRALGKLLGREEEAERLATYCEQVLADTDAVMEKVGDNRANLLYCMGDAGLNVTASGSLQAEVVNKVSNNVAQMDNPSTRGTGNEANLEQIILWDPEVIFFSPESIYDKVGDSPAWQEVTAIKNDNYYKAPMGPVNWMVSPPSVNRYLGMLWAPKVLYPDVADYDLYEKVKEYFELFYHTELTREQYDELMKDSL